MLSGYWTAICRGAGGRSCAVDDTPLPPDPPRSAAGGPLVDIPGIESAVGPDGRTMTTVSAAVLFAGDSARLTADAHAVLDAVADRIGAAAGSAPGHLVEVRGFVADPPGSTAEGRQALAAARAAAVGDHLAGRFAAAGRDIAVNGAGFGPPAGSPRWSTGSSSSRSRPPCAP